MNVQKEAAGLAPYWRPSTSDFQILPCWRGGTSAIDMMSRQSLSRVAAAFTLPSLVRLTSKSGRFADWQFGGRQRTVGFVSGNSRSGYISSFWPPASRAVLVNFRAKARRQRRRGATPLDFTRGRNEISLVAASWRASNGPIQRLRPRVKARRT